MSFEVDIGHATHRGARAGNEDFTAAARPPRHDEGRGVIAAIADGVSTGGGGLEAAQTTVLSVVSDFHAVPDTWDISVVLDRLIGAQNAWLADHNRRRQGAHRREPDAASVAMTTLTALVLRGQAWTLAHVGDTRAWLLRAGECSQLTQDHAFSEAFQQSRLMRAIGLDDQVRVDFERGDLRRGDVFVLTTDGVHGVLSRVQIAAIVTRLLDSGDAHAASQELVDAAIRAGSSDNATAMVVHVKQLIAGRFADWLVPARDLRVPPRLKAGDTLDAYLIDATIADNGVHRLYRARSKEQGSVVVIKTLTEAQSTDPQERAMLIHEAWLGSRIGDRTPPRGEAAFVCAHATQDATALYTVFDWHDGATLEQMLVSGRIFEVNDIVDAALACARALARLHRHGVIHRDIKPGNLHLGDDGSWRVLDLGAALSGSDPAEFKQLRAGTPSYMNPEQWSDGADTSTQADEASDVYALGVTLYQWLTTKLPYGDVEPYQTGRFRRDPKPPSRLRPDVPIWLDHIVLKAVALERAHRFDSAEELVVALERASARPLGAPHVTPLIARDPTALWKIGLGASLLFNALLIYWLLFLPH
jgi:serine/threonine protein phosphatase PrpC/serine/threonine protein kinase